MRNGARTENIKPVLKRELAIRNAYSSLGLYLGDLAVRTNSVFGKEVLRIEGSAKSATDGEFRLELGFLQLPQPQT